MITLTFLGTSSMVPTKERNVQSIFLKFKAEGMLIDCGEGTQRQMNIAGINRNEITKILISHWHGDHVSGLIGLIQTMGNSGSDTLVIYGPLGTKEYFGNLMRSCIFDSKMNIRVEELNPAHNEALTFFEDEDFALECVQLSHSVPCLGYAFIEKDRRRIDLDKAKQHGLKEGPLLGKVQQGQSIMHEGKHILAEEVTYLVEGKKVAFILDTEPCEGCLLIAENADVLVSESSFSSNLTHKAEEFRHMTAKDAALIAQEAGVKKLILTHFSQRYKTVEEVLDEAKTIFPETEAAYDFMKVKL
ncbi:MAG: ribonuclease Z [archaeon]